jgi:sugar phosphate permease
VALLLISGVAVFMLAPYTFCSGVLAVRIGGQRGGSTSAGLIDTTGYLGAIVSGFGIGMLAEKYGWATAFGSLAGVALLTLAIAGIYALVNRRIDRNLSVSSRNQPHPESASE